ncbi:MAG: hypothetical protein ACXVEU_20240 [Nocardioidaceae bacterium]
MAERVVFHVGPPKTGTTYLQSVLWNHRDELLDAGVLLPGRRAFDHNLAAAYVRLDQPTASMERAWGEIVEQVHSWPGTAVLSNEWFALADREQARAALETFAPAATHVVATARDLLSVAPAAWQETLKLGRATDLDDFVASLDEDGRRWCWATLDPADVLARWAERLPPERVHVVTVPPSSAPRNTLWARFAAACSIPAGACDPTDVQANESLGAESARFLELMGPRLRAAVDADTAVWSEQYRWLRQFLAHRLLVPRGGSKIQLRRRDARRLRRRAAAVAPRVAAAGYDVVGELSDLDARTAYRTAVHPGDVSTEEVFQVACDLVVSLLREVRDASAPDQPATPPR